MNRNDQGMERMHAMNGKRGPPSQRPRDLPRELPREMSREMSREMPREMQREVPNSQHDAIITYILDSWNTVISGVQGDQGNENKVTYYHEPNLQLKGELDGDLTGSRGAPQHKVFQERNSSHKQFRHNQHRS